MDAKERIESLIEILNEANYRYYVMDDPAIPDFEYDRMLRELEDLEKAGLGNAEAQAEVGFCHFWGHKVT